MGEKLFGLVSLVFLAVGFIVGVAGADKDGPKDLANATDQLIQHVTLAHEAEEINSSQTYIPPSNDEVNHTTHVITVESVKAPKKIK
jgi:hypothetical protein